MPAFLVPFVFVLDPQGIGLLLKLPKDGSWIDIVEITLKTGLGLGALTVAALLITTPWGGRNATAYDEIAAVASPRSTGAASSSPPASSDCWRSDGGLCRSPAAQAAGWPP